MKKTILSLLMLTAIGASAQNFTKVTTGGGSENEYAIGIKKDAAGNTFIAGSFDGSLILGSENMSSKGNYDSYVAKMNPSGGYDWVIQVGGSESDYINSLEVDANGNCYIAGNYTASSTVFTSSGTTDLNANSGGKDYFVIKLSTAGTVEKAVVGDTSDESSLESIAIGSDGRVFIAGEIILAGGVTNGFISMLAMNGFTSGWAQPFTGSFSSFARGIAVDPNGVVHISGHFNTEVNLAPGITITGTATSTGFIAAYTNSGTYLGNKIIDGGSSAKIHMRRAVAHSADIYINALFSGSVVIGTKTFSSSGAGSDGLVLALSYNSTTKEYVTKWTAEQNAGAGGLISNNDIYVKGSYVYSCGYFFLSMSVGTHTFNAGSFDLNGYSVCYNGSGNLVWAKPVTGNGQNIVYGITGDEKGNATMVGSFMQTASYGSISKLSNGERDFFIAELAAGGASIRKASGATFCTLYPNPANEVVNLTFNDNVSAELINIFSPAGKLVRTLNINDLSNLSINISDLPAGIYMLEVRQENKHSIARFIKQ